MYIVLVGPSGSRKGTAMRPAFELLNMLGIRMSAEAITREALIQELHGSSNVDVADANIITDSGGVGSQLDASLTIFSQELSVFLGQNNWQLISDLTDWFDCRDKWTYRTKNSGVNEIWGVWVNLFGATTPDFLQASLPQEAIGGGLTSRIVFVYGDKKSKLCPEPFITNAELVLREKLRHDLERINILTGEFAFTEQFRKKYREWYIAHSEKPPFADDDNLDGYNERRPLHLRKISMAISASRSDDMLLDVGDFDRALSILVETEKLMRFTFSGRGRAPLSVVLEKIVRLLTARGQLRASEILKLYYRDITHTDLEEMIRTLKGAKICTAASDGSDLILTYTPKKRGTEDKKS
jgi:hypothetical protein